MDGWMDKSFLSLYIWNEAREQKRNFVERATIVDVITNYFIASSFHRQ